MPIAVFNNSRAGSETLYCVKSIHTLHIDLRLADKAVAQQEAHILEV